MVKETPVKLPTIHPFPFAFIPAMIPATTIDMMAHTKIMIESVESLIVVSLASNATKKLVIAARSKIIPRPNMIAVVIFFVSVMIIPPLLQAYFDKQGDRLLISGKREVIVLIMKGNIEKKQDDRV